MQYEMVRCSTVRFRMRCGMMRHGLVWFARYSLVLNGRLKYCIVWYEVWLNGIYDNFDDFKIILYIV